MMKPEEIQTEYDVALSYASEDRAYVEEVAALLVAGGITCFFDRYQEASLWGKDLYQHLHDVYFKRSRYTIVFISKHYAAKIWTNHELRSAQARALHENREYVLPARLDDTEIPGLNPNTAYIDLQSLNASDFAELIFQKLNIRRKITTDTQQVCYVVISRKQHERRRKLNPGNDILSRIANFVSRDPFDYQRPFKVYIDSEHVGDILDGSTLLVETAPGRRVFKANAKYVVDIDYGEAIGSEEREVKSAEYPIVITSGRNEILFEFEEGHIEFNKVNGVGGVYFKKVSS
jgi:hypothetical protein